jgi:hypothetical protein
VALLHLPGFERSFRSLPVGKIGSENFRFTRANPGRGAFSIHALPGFFRISARIPKKVFITFFIVMSKTLMNYSHKVVSFLSGYVKISDKMTIETI